MMSNAEIRKYVKDNIKGKYGKILGFALLVGLISGIASGIVNVLLGALSKNDVLGALLTGLAAAVVAPLTVGLYKAVMNIVENKEVKIDNLFDYFKDFSNLFIIGAICNIAIELIDAVVPIIGTLLEYFYIGMLYLYIFNPTMKPMDVIKNGFEKMKNKFWDAFILNLSYTWPIIVVILVAALVLFAGNADSFFTIVRSGNWNLLFSGNTVTAVIAAILLLLAVAYVIVVNPLVYMSQNMLYTQIMKNGAAIPTVNPQNPVNAASVNVPNANNVNAQPMNNAANPTTPASFCTNCGSKVEGAFCTNCGNKIN